MWIAVGVSVAVVLVGGVGALGFLGYQHLQTQAASFAGAATDNGDGTQTIANLDGTLELTIPDHWSPLSPSITGVPGADTQLQVGNMFREEYLLVLSISKADMPGATLETYNDSMREGWQEEMASPLIGQTETLSVGNASALRTLVRGTVEGVKVGYVVTAIDGRDHMHAILQWTLLEKFDSKRQEMARIADTFIERTGPAPSEP